MEFVLHRCRLDADRSNPSSAANINNLLESVCITGTYPRIVDFSVLCVLTLEISKTSSATICQRLGI